MEKRKYGSNIHILDEDTIKDFEMKYPNVHISGDYIIFPLSYQNYTRAYRLGDKFNAMASDKTKMAIQPIAVEYWKNHKGHSLFRVQNAINKLIIFNQDVTNTNIAKALESK